VPDEIARAVMLPQGYGDIENVVHPACRWLRENMPIGRAEIDGYDPVWIVSKHAHVSEIYRDATRFHNADHNIILYPKAGDEYLRGMLNGTTRVGRVMHLLSATDDAVFPAAAHGIDFEGELGAITGDVPMGASAAEALSAVRLLVQINDWSLRVLGAAEMRTGFGWVTAKPACSLAPVAVTPDELGDAWGDGRLSGTLEVAINGKSFGDVPTAQMEFGFHELIAHAAKTRNLCAGTIIGSGTASSPDYAQVGSCCIAERRAIETIANGAADTGFLRSGDRVAMTGRVGSDAPFGTIDQQVVVRS